MSESASVPKRRKPLYAHLYFQVLVAIAIGVGLGHFYPDFAKELRPLGDGFIKLVKMMITPIIFATVVVGIAKMGDLKRVGRVGLKAIVYFEVVTTLALFIGLVVVNLVQPGAGINHEITANDRQKVADYAQKGEAFSTANFILHIIPDSVVGAFANGEILQVLFFSILFGLALSHYGEKGKPIVDLLDRLSHVLFGVIGIIMRFAPIGALGAMAFTVGDQGLKVLANLATLMACVYATCFLFIVLVLGTICRLVGFSLWKFLRYIKEEILIVLGTSSSEAALPRLMTKLELAGCSESVVGLVVPTGYSFNLDGTSIYLTMAAVFIAQATNTPLTIAQQGEILAVLLLTSKGSAAVTGAGFITLAATLSVVSHIPVAGLALLVGIDRFMSEARAITNLIGNGVATMVVARWEGALDLERARRVMSHTPEAIADEPEAVADAALPAAVADGSDQNANNV